MTAKIVFRPRHYRVAMRLDNGAHVMLTLGTLDLKTSKMVWLSDAGAAQCNRGACAHT